MSCDRCGEIFIGTGRGLNGEHDAFQQATAQLQRHHCMPLPLPDPVPTFTAQQWSDLKNAIHIIMPDVTVYSHKV